MAESRPERRLTGRCVVSGEPCFEVLETWPAGHPSAGEPRRLGRPLPKALRVTLVLLDGTTTTVTVCADHLAEVTAALPRVWHALCRKMRHDRKSHRELGQRDFNADQHAAADAANLRFIDNRPLGILCHERWSEVIG